MKLVAITGSGLFLVLIINLLLITLAYPSVAVVSAATEVELAKEEVRRLSTSLDLAAIRLHVEEARQKVHPNAGELSEASQRFDRVAQALAEARVRQTQAERSLIESKGFRAKKHDAFWTTFFDFGQ